METNKDIKETTITPEEEKKIRLKKRIGIGVLALSVLLILYIIRLTGLIG